MSAPPHIAAPLAQRRSALHRPLLQAHARVLRRDDDFVQIGTLDRGLVIGGLAADEIDRLRRVGARRLGGPTKRDDPDAMAPVLVDSTRLSAIFARLADEHLLLANPTRLEDLRGLDPELVWGFAPDAAARSSAYGLDDDGFPLLRHRARAAVVVDGQGRLTDQIASCLREGGIGSVQTGADAVGAADLALRRRCGTPPDLVVIVAEAAVPHQVAQGWRRHDVAHLPVVVDGPLLRVGPLVTGAGPCLACVDLHRTDRDPAWPQLLAQLAPPRPGETPPAEAEGGLRALATGLVATFVFGAIDGFGPPRGLSAAYRLPSPQASHVVWRPHASCRPCADRRQWTRD